ncbi:MAG: hypothetical protein ABI898_03710 [Sphingomonadales bacterium]
MRIPFVAGIVLILAGCATVPVGSPPQLAATRSPPMLPTGLDRVLGQTARGLTTLFGDANQDVREAQGARRLQFAGPICILDAYLYPPKGGESGEGTVTYVDARQPDGRDIDRASCVAALTRRKEAR